MNRVFRLCAEGDVKIEWDPNDAEATAKARAEVEALAAAGYQFFLVDGAPADAVAAGKGMLSCQRVPVERLMEPPAEGEPEEFIPKEAEPHGKAAPKPGNENIEPGRRRGRPPGSGAAPADQTAVAVRQPRGG